MSEKDFAVVGLGNALMDALIRLDNDDFLTEQALNKGVMHSVANDVWMKVYDALHAAGKQADLQTGGSCANSIAALGLMGAKVSYCGHVGNDHFGEMYVEQLKEACGHHSLILGEGVTGKCLSLVSPDIERTMLTDLGDSVNLPSIEHFKAVIEGSQVFYSTGYLLLGDPMKSHLLEAAKVAKAAGVKVAFDVADAFVIDLVRDEMKAFIEEYVDICFLNEAEAKSMTQSDDATNAFAMLKDMCETIVVKLGGRGSVVYSKGEMAKADIFKVKAIDSTGAGDSFAAGFLYAYTAGWPLEQSVRLASRIASETVAQLGAVVRVPNRLRELVVEIQG